MGKKGTKRRTRWKALPLSGEDGGSCSEDEVSTTSSGRGPSLVLRMRDRAYRNTQRSSDRDRSREPLVKCESKTFDEEEYTKITTPRQDVLFKKGYFARRKLESSIEEGVHITQEGEGEEGPMEQMIITNGFVDERGHYLVNGTSYEIYDPYTNTVTVVVGPPPYTNGVSPPVLAAVSCQPVPLQPVDWYPPNGAPGEWPPGPAWAPAYPKTPEEAEGEGPATPKLGGAEEPPLFAPPFLFSSLVYPVPFGLNGVGEQPIEPEEETSEVSKSPTTFSGIQQESSVDTESSSSFQMKPPQEEFVPSIVLKPPTKEFIPSSVLKPPTTEFVPQALKPNGVVFVPGQTPTMNLKPTGAVFVPRQMPLIPATSAKAPPQESTISTQNADIQLQNAIAPVPELPTISDSTHPTFKEPVQNTSLLQQLEVPEKKSVEITEPTAPDTVLKVASIECKPSVQEVKGAKVEVEVVETEKSLETAPVIHSAPLTQESHGTQTPPELSQISPKVPTPSPQRRAPPQSPRRSYAKTVSTGLDPRPPTEPLISGKPVLSVKDTKADNKESDGKRIIQNGTILTNGHDIPERLNGRDITKNNRRYGGDKETNGFIETNDHGKSNWHNGVSSHPSGKGRLGGGREKNSRKETKEVFTRRDRETNGYDQNSGRGRDVPQNGLHNGKERLINGKERSASRLKAETPKRAAQIHLSTEELENKSDNLSDQVDDSDNNQEQFRPVEHRRSRVTHNGFVRKFSPQIRPESTDKEVMEPVQLKEISSSTEPKPLMPRRDSVHKDSDKSSTISELSSPTELSSGQTTPPDLAAVVQIEETHAKELNKSVEKLREDLEERKPKKANKKGKKNGMARRVEVKALKEEEIFEEPPPLPEFLQVPRDDLMDLDLEDTFDHVLLRSLRQNEHAISKVNLFPPRVPIFPCDLYTRTNLSQMRATKPEEFFASIVETPVASGELTRTCEKPRKTEKPVKTTVDLRPTVRKSINTAYKPSRKPLKEEQEETPKEEKQEPRLGIVDAVKTWLESQEGALTSGETTTPEPKNGESNPSRAPSAEGDDGGCRRVAESSSDLSSLTDARVSVDKYYSLSVRRVSKTSETSDVSEQEAVDALEYAFPRPPALAAHNFPTKDLACKLQ